LEDFLLQEDLGTAEAAARAMCQSSRWQSSREALIAQGGAVQRLQNRLPSVKETQQIRVLSLFVELGRASETDIFPALEACGAFKNVLNAFLTDDLMLKLNAVELMDALGSYQAGQELLCQHGVPEKLAADLTDPCCDESVRLCVIRLLGFVILRDPSAMSKLLQSKQAPLAQGIAAFMQSRNPVERLCGLQVFASIASHQCGLEFFLRWPETLNDIIAAASAPQNDVCKAGIGAWTVVLNLRQRPADNQDGAQTIDIDLWKLAEDQLLPLVLKSVITKPFPDVRTCTWRLLAVLVRSQNAARKMLVADEMREKLLDFASDTESDAKIAKHEFVRELVRRQGTWLAAFLDENIDMMLSEYAKQGPFWSPQVTTVGLANQGAM
jgi:hypothetical protein